MPLSKPNLTASLHLYCLNYLLFYPINHQRNKGQTKNSSNNATTSLMLIVRTTAITDNDANNLHISVYNIWVYFLYWCSSMEIYGVLHIIGNLTSRQIDWWCKRMCKPDNFWRMKQMYIGNQWKLKVVLMLLGSYTPRNMVFLTFPYNKKKGTNFGWSVKDKRQKNLSSTFHNFVHWGKPPQSSGHKFNFTMFLTHKLEIFFSFSIYLQHTSW